MDNKSSENKSKKGLMIGISATAVILTAALITVLVLFVFQPKQEKASDPLSGEDHVRLTVWTSGDTVELTKKQCEDFVKQYPDKDIDIDVTDHPIENATMVLSGDITEPGDVFSFGSDQIDKLNNIYLLSPVEQPDDIASRNCEPAVNAVTIDGTLCAYPISADIGYFLLYDKSVVSDEDAKTLEGVLSACRKAGKKLMINAANGFYSAVFPFTGGLTLEGVEIDSQLFNDYDEASVTDTLCAFSKLFHDYSDVIISDQETDAAVSGFKNGTVAAAIDGSWDISDAKKALGESFGAAKLPTVTVNGAPRQLVSLHGYRYLGVNAATPFPHTAHLLAAYLTDEQAQLTCAKELGVSPTNLKAMSDPSVTDNPSIAALLAQSEHSVPLSNVAMTFWSPMGELGKYVAKGNSDRAAMQKEFEKMIEQTKDE